MKKKKLFSVQDYIFFILFLILVIEGLYKMINDPNHLKGIFLLIFGAVGFVCNLIFSLREYKNKE